ncbi:MAG: DUF4837 family protein [Gemmatimonadota bacterium]|jgi:hypothetical protein
MRKLAIIALLAVAASSCENTTSGMAYGDANSIIAVMAPTLWEEVQGDVYDALEPTIKTVRSEKTFNVTFQDPSNDHWSDLRRFRQLLLVGTGNEDWMQQALAKAREDVNGPGLYHAYDVWAVNQQVTIIVVTPGSEEAELKSHLPEVNEILDRQYREWAKNRMYMTGVDSALADTLMQQARFQILVPKVYRWTHQDSVYSFRNDNPDPSELIRQITVTWKTPVPDGYQPEDILAWRKAISEGFNEPQDVDLSDADAGPMEFRGRQAYQIQAIWKNPPELNWPAAGPFITRAVVCPQQNRMYLLDGWLYAPGKDKYEYMIQLQTILDSFRCGPS